MSALRDLSLARHEALPRPGQHPLGVDAHGELLLLLAPDLIGRLTSGRLYTRAFYSKAP